MVIKPILLLGLAAEYTSQRWVWSTVVRRTSEVYDTHRRTKLTAPETISRSRDTTDAQQNVNGSRDLTTPLSWMICHPRACTCCSQPTYTKCEISISTHCDNTKTIQNVENGVVWGSWGHSRSLEIAPIDRIPIEFLLAFHCKYVPILHRFRDLAKYWSKFAGEGWPRWNFA